MRKPLSLACVLAGSIIYAQEVDLLTVATGFTSPTDLESAGDSRMFVVERPGLIKIIGSDGVPLAQPFLDITDRVHDDSGEQGLLGLAFHPMYDTNGYFYVNYIYGTGAGQTRISRFSVTADPNVADPASELIIWTTPQPSTVHNGGDLTFGPDGYLWFALGDGGTSQAAQDMTSPLGKMIRIDVNGGSPYAIPADNPYASSDPSTALPEIWASGMRNPFRFSFDELGGDIWIADVGEGEYEEVDLWTATNHTGANFGWPCYEGPAPLETTGCSPSSAYDLPIYWHDHSTEGWCSVIGGYVYRGTASPSLYGKYIYTDFCHGEIHALAPDGAGGWLHEQLSTANGMGAASFGVDEAGELWLANTINGTVYHLVGTASAGTVQVDAKVFLEGPLDAATGSMTDALRAGGHIPLQETYTVLGMPQVAGGGGETTTQDILAITGANAVVDWIRLELRSAADATVLVATRQALLLRNGDIMMADGSSDVSFNVGPGNYFVVITHRNHLSIMTENAIPLSDQPVTMDLRSPATPVFGTGARKPMGSWAAMWAGDVSMDGTIKYVGSGNDRDIILTVIGGVTPTNTVTGYRRSDVNMDGVVRYTGSSNDRDLILSNIGGVIPTQVKMEEMP